MKCLVTGVAGFIGYHVAEALLAQGANVVGIDNVNDYYDVRLKRARLARLKAHRHFDFHEQDISDYERLSAIGQDFDIIVHLAAQAGVRFSMDHPFSYASANLTGHLSILELARRCSKLSHLIYASSSSVYGAGTPLPYAESARADRPQSLYAATKRADELMSVSYSHLYGLRQTGLRFFTVYGPWGRPDMAYFSFAEAIACGRPITLYDRGRLKRDFTYIDDIVDGVLGVISHPPLRDGSHRLYNIGNNKSETVSDLVALLGVALGREAIVIDAPRPAADPVETCADISAIADLAGYQPKTQLKQGIDKFVGWYRIWSAERD